MTTILGLASGFHDAAAALVVDGALVAAIEQERLTRRKHDPSFPAEAADACLAVAQLDPGDIDVVALHEKPLGVVDRHLSTRLRAGPSGLGSLVRRTPSVLATQLGVGFRVARWFRDRGVPTPAVRFVEHHVSHAAASFLTSPFGAAAVLTVDGVGEWSTATSGVGRGARVRLDDELRFPDSVGLLYTAFTTYCGFRANSGEGELMGLAPYGEPRFADRILDRLVQIDERGAAHLDQRYFAYLGGERMTSRAFHDLFGGPPRAPGDPVTQREADLAASIQGVLERILVAMASDAVERSGTTRLCLGGGVALNCVANAAVLERSGAEELFVPPSPGDGGSAVGAALWVWHELLGQPRPDPEDRWNGSFLGPAFSAEEVAAFLDDEGVEHVRLAAGALEERVVHGLADGALVGWFVGRMEFGPRALGHRSILADARDPAARGRLNRAVKERATFRPFAPAVLAERAAEYFEITAPSPYMTRTAPVVASLRRDGTVSLDDDEPVMSTIPAVTHVDGSARVQTVQQQSAPELHRLLQELERQTRCPMVLNTSFNARDEPIVCTPADALATFRRTGLDLLVMEDCVVERAR